MPIFPDFDGLFVVHGVRRRRARAPFPGSARVSSPRDRELSFAAASSITSAEGGQVRFGETPKPAPETHALPD